MPQICRFLQQNKNFLEQILNYYPFSKPMLNLKLTLFRSRLALSITVKAGQAYPPKFYQWIDYLKNKPVTGVKFKSAFLHA